NPMPATTPDDVLVVHDMPDELPPCAALITSVPQTPLAHVAVLARNRGIPNAYLGLASSAPDLAVLARDQRPVVVRARWPDALDVVELTDDEWSHYRSLRTTSPIDVQVADLTSAPLTLDLSI